MKYLLIITLAFALFSCKQSGSDSLSSAKEVDSLKMLSLEKDRQMNNLVAALIEIDDNLQMIKEKEKIITLNVAKSEDGGQAIEDQINNDIKAIYDLMLQNKEQIAKLEKQLTQSANNNNDLNKMVKRLNSQLRDKSLEIAELQRQLASQNLKINDLNFTIEGLESAIDSLEGAKLATQQELNETTEKLYRAYYVFGSKKELKDENIISSDGFLSKKKILSEGFSQEYFTTIDYREFDSLNVFMPKAKLLTNHPTSSYTLEASEDGAMVLKVTDKANFWSMTRHLVIQVGK